MTRFGTLLLPLCVVVAALTGCAHPINLEPMTLPLRDEATLSAKSVAYVMSDADRAKQVVTAGGGGDKVSYYPYRDMEKALRTALRSVYADVSVLKSAGDPTALRQAGVAYVFAPEIVTTSSSSSLLTWPPTSFTAEVSCTVTDAGGTVVARLKAIGSGTAEFDEFKSDLSLAARRAVSDVAERLAQEIRNADSLR